MKRFFCCLTVLLGLFLPAAEAANVYLIPDSDTRLLTEEELWQWRYDALGYALNEIFARHGFPFDPGGSYDKWFSRQTWYRTREKATKSQCYDRLTPVEWENEMLIKQVRQDMRAAGTLNEEGKTLPGLEPDLFNIPNIFEEYLFTPGQRLAVYTGPGYHYLRGTNGKALTSTNGTVYVAGMENGWILLLYRTDKGAARMGYAEAAGIKDAVYARLPALQMYSVTANADCYLTDDPVTGLGDKYPIHAGQQLTYLFPMYNDRGWAYVEAAVNGAQVRGCVPLECVSEGISK